MCWCLQQTLKVEDVLSRNRIIILGHFSRKLEDTINEMVFVISKEGSKTPTAEDFLKMLDEEKTKRSSMEEYEKTYRKINKLGEGGQAKVYLVEN